MRPVAGRYSCSLKCIFGGKKLMNEHGSEASRRFLLKLAHAQWLSSQFC
jgi:hypothetical protein